MAFWDGLVTIGAAKFRIMVAWDVSYMRMSKNIALFPFPSFPLQNQYFQLTWTVQSELSQSFLWLLMTEMCFSCVYWARHESKKYPFWVLVRYIRLPNFRPVCQAQLSLPLIFWTLFSSYSFLPTAVNNHPIFFRDWNLSSSFPSEEGRIESIYLIYHWMMQWTRNNTQVS